MKTRFCCLLFLCAAFFVLKAGPAGYEKIDRAVFIAKTGKWSDAQNWNTKALPAGNVSPLIPSGSSATLDCPVSVTSAVYLGNKPAVAATLSIVDGAKAEVGFLSVHPALKNVLGYVRMTGGELSVGFDKDRRGMLMVGAGGTFAGTAIMEVSGGKIEGGITVGSRFPQTQVGTLSVHGTLPKITSKEKVRCYLLLNASGTLEFVLDEKGVAPFDFKTKNAIFILGCKIRVDGAHYKGGAQSIPLIIAKEFDGAPPAAEIVNFSTDYRTEVVTEGKSTLVLKITSSQK